jgi:hypothetical protein
MQPSYAFLRAHLSVRPVFSKICQNLIRKMGFLVSYSTAPTRKNLVIDGNHKRRNTVGVYHCTLVFGSVLQTSVPTDPDF